MRVISKDRSINVPYESYIFVICKDEHEENQYHVALRLNDFLHFVPLATYSTKEEAQAVFNNMVSAGTLTPNGTFSL